MWADVFLDVALSIVGLEGLRKSMLPDVRLRTEFSGIGAAEQSLEALQAVTQKRLSTSNLMTVQEVAQCAIASVFPKQEDHPRSRITCFVLRLRMNCLVLFAYPAGPGSFPIALSWHCARVCVQRMCVYFR